MKLFRLFCASVLMLPLLGFSSWQPSQAPAISESFSAATRHPLQPEGLLLASDHGIFERNSSGAWRTLWSATFADEKIHRLVSFQDYPDFVFALTNEGLIQISLRQKIARSVYTNGVVLSFEIVPNRPHHWLIGTDTGLYESKDAGRTWSRFLGLSHRKRVTLLRFVGSKFFAGAGRHLYLSAGLTNFKPVFTFADTDEEDIVEDLSAEEDPFNDSEEITFLDTLTDLEVSGDFCENMWLGTSQGVFESEDCGNAWEPLPSTGMRNQAVRRLSYSRETGKLFAATADGIYEWRPADSRWEEHYQGLTDTAPRDMFTLSTMNGDHLVALTRDGLVRFPISIELSPVSKVWLNTPERHALFRQLLASEPSAQEIQKAVVRYGNLSNRKINRWQRQSRLRALVPTFSFGRDYDRSNNIDIDRGSSSVADVYISGPEDISRGWDFDISWDLGDFIWSSSQTSIDSRQKLMVDQRQDLLAEATRIFHERRRLQMEAAFSPAEHERVHLERLIRLDELTALLDAMTGGLMSERLEVLYRERPNLERLWEYSSTLSAAAHGPTSIAHTPHQYPGLRSDEPSHALLAAKAYSQNV